MKYINKSNCIENWGYNYSSEHELIRLVAETLSRSVLPPPSPAKISFFSCILWYLIFILRKKKAKINFGFGLFRWLSSNGCMCVTHFFPFLVDSLLLLSLMEYVNRFALCASARRRRLSVVAAAARRHSAAELKPWKQSLSFRNICRVDATKDM